MADNWRVHERATRAIRMALLVRTRSRPVPLVTLFDHLDGPTIAPRARLRRPAEEPTDPRHSDRARRVKGGAWQARFYVGPGPGDAVNLGLFTTAVWGEDAKWAALRASREFRRFYNPANPERDLRRAFEYLKRRKVSGRSIIPEDLLPPRVRREGHGYIGNVKKAGRVLRTEVHADAWAAYEAMCAILAREFPADPPRVEGADRDRALVTLADFIRAV